MRTNLGIKPQKTRFRTDFRLIFCRSVAQGRFANIYNGTCKFRHPLHSLCMPLVKKMRLLFYSLAALELILLSAYQAWGKAIVR